MTTPTQVQDLRKVISPEHPNADIEIAWRLQHVPPFETDMSGDGELWAQTSGLDCLAQVLRHIFSREGSQGFGKLLKNEAAMANENANPILKYAWQTFERDPSLSERAQMAAATAAKMAVLEELFSGEEQPHGHQFMDLCQSPVMGETFWLDERFKAWTVVLRQRPSGEWVTAKWKDRSGEGRAGCLRFDPEKQPWHSLQGFINGKLGEAAAAEETSENRLLHISAWPRVMRVLYTPKAEGRLRFSQLRSFEMPYVAPEVAVESLALTGKAPVQAYLRYTLMAVVRLGDQESDPDYVRTYDAHGHQIALSYRPASFVNDSWSVEDSCANKYMLFYGPGEAGTFPHACPPEVAIRPPPFEKELDEELGDIWQIMKAGPPPSARQRPQAGFNPPTSRGPHGPDGRPPPTAPRAMLERRGTRARKT
ncbi:hypothetical protein VFPBJ_08921 [Purpureocillium lilacinum]|uniref:Uncharacterized protein n=1 Tax=Purpureocillium lilacinum TaxID=33203 RepID=A0A179GGQ9_PURLI|nr:hypothetical protein Purlil1_936 [Purpureocillium lilacinum]OAQ76561.1 hypothetical protein VFPBJ_08921 [Purpureocillium lilacinum]GJN75889.1 hypothetical protein PLICBS_009997 [Purpureocillium lilacinum]